MWYNRSNPCSSYIIKVCFLMTFLCNVFLNKMASQVNIVYSFVNKREIRIFYDISIKYYVSMIL